jgi:hypothetical protein
VLLAGAIVVGIVAVALVFRQSRLRPLDSLAAAYAVVGFCLAVGATIAAAAHRVTDWRQSTVSLPVALGVPLAVAALTGAAGWFLARALAEDTSKPAVAQPPAFDVAGRRTWTGSTTNPVIVACIPALLALAVITSAWVEVVIAFAVATAARVRVSVDPEAIRVVMGYLPVVHITIPIADITGVEAVDVRPLSVGGWGFRFRGGTVLVVRGGSALRVQRRDKRPLTVTIPEADVAAAVIAGLVSSSQS